MLFFPALFVWCELVLHIADGADFKYCIIYILFGLSAGFVLDLVPALVHGKAARVSADVLGALIPLAYCIEFIAKVILQTYYPLSTLGTAADNKLYQFIGIIITKTLQSIPVILLMFLPVLAELVFTAKGGKLFGKLKDGRLKSFLNYLIHKDDEDMPRKAAALLIAAAAVCHLAGLAAVYALPWADDVTPRQLYESDTDFNYQVEQLGLYNFLRLDVRHMIVPAKTEETDFSALQASLPEPAASEPVQPDPVQAEPQPADPEQPETPEEPVIDTSPNVMDIDFAALREGTKKKDVQWLCDYFSSLAPTDKNEYTGMFEGYNVVLITVEALSGYAISEEYTPTLWKLQHEGFHFNNFYTALHYTSTSNGECQNLLGLYPKNGNPISMKRTGELKDNMYFSLAQQLGRKGYKNWGYHDNWDLYGRMDSHSNLGYYWQFSYRGLTGDLKPNGDLQWPQKDTVMIDESVDDFAIEPDPFNVYYLTVSGHVPFGWNWATAEYKEALADAPYSELAKGYIASVMEADRAVQKLIDWLKAAGKLNKTLSQVGGHGVATTAARKC
ncbi:MAG: sulfatase-like hydrolase/transferase [Firmicutes bacterium]|nr:sulfatase-like hydrolase/transferase [Bacillota bacterium]